MKQVNFDHGITAEDVCGDLCAIATGRGVSVWTVYDGVLYVTLPDDLSRDIMASAQPAPTSFKHS